MAATTEGNVKAEIKGDKLIVEIDITKDLGTTSGGNKRVCNRRFTPDGQPGGRNVTFQFQGWEK